MSWKTWVLVVVVLGGRGLASEFGEGFAVKDLFYKAAVDSQYISPEGIEVSNDPRFSQMMQVSLENGLYGSVWHAYGLGDWSPSEGGEDRIHVEGGWSGKVGERDLLTMGVAHWDRVKLLSGPDGDIFYTFAELTHEFSKRDSMIARVSYQHVDGNVDVARGIYFVTGWNHKSRFLGMGVVHSPQLIFDDGAYGKKSGVGFRYQLAFSYPVNDWITFFPLVFRVHVPIYELCDMETEVVFTSGVKMDLWE